MAKLSETQKQNLIHDYIHGDKYCNFSVLSRKYGIAPVNVKYLLKKRNIQLLPRTWSTRRFSLNENYFSKIDTPEKAYIVGLLFADGTHDIKRSYIALSLQERDKGLLDRFNDFLESDRPLKFIPLNKKNKNYANHYKLDINSKIISNDLLKIGMMPNKTLKIKFPLKCMPKIFYPDFIRGYMDGDGCIYIPNNGKCDPSVQITSTVYMTESIRKIIEKELGIYCNYNKLRSFINKSTRTLRISGRQQVLKFLNWIYKNDTISMTRKKNKYIQIRDYVLIKKRCPQPHHPRVNHSTHL